MGSNRAVKKLSQRAYLQSNTIASGLSSCLCHSSGAISLPTGEIVGEREEIREMETSNMAK